MAVRKDYSSFPWVRCLILKSPEPEGSQSDQERDLARHKGTLKQSSHLGLASGSPGMVTGPHFHEGWTSPMGAL